MNNLKEHRGMTWGMIHRWLMASTIFVFLLAVRKVAFSSEEYAFEAALSMTQNRSTNAEIVWRKNITINDRFFTEQSGTEKKGNEVSTEFMQTFRIGAIMNGQSPNVLLAERQTGQTTLLKLGDCFQGWMLETITSDRLIFKNGGMRKEMKF